MEEQLHKKMDELRQEIDELPSDDSGSKERLEELLEKLELRAEYPAEADNQLIQGLSDSVTHFEVFHPRVTAILNDLMMTLSNMGI